MKILHMMLSNFYIDNYNYQENILPRQNKNDGHEVLIIASTETFISNITLGYICPGQYLNEDGIKVKRVAYRWIPSKFLQRKIRSYVDIYKMICDFSPDVIMFHGVASLELLNASKYKKNNPNTKLYVDSHSDYNNSGKSFLSRYILHKKIYKYFLTKALPNIDKVFYLSYETKKFLEEVYCVPEYSLEYLPLGGIIVNDELRKKNREKILLSLNLKSTDILFMHSGKMDKDKRTLDLIKAFSATNGGNLSLIIIGSMTDDVKRKSFTLINKDPRIQYLGWKNSNELIEYLSACDLYVQPGGQSATMQNALCCGSAAALYPHESHKYLLGDSVFYIESAEDMKDLFEQIARDPEILEDKRKMSFELAKEKLDYKKIAARLYE